MAPRYDWNELVFADEAVASTLSRAAVRGVLARVGPGIYVRPTRGVTPEEIVRRRHLAILAHEFRGAVITGRSIRKMLDHEGRIFVVHPRRRPLKLPGLTIIPRRGPGPLTGDGLLTEGIYLASIPRGLLDNLAGRGEPYLGPSEVERWIADLAASRGEDYLNAIRDEAHALAVITGQATALRRLDALIGAAVATRDAYRLVTDGLRARTVGLAHDPERLERFRALFRDLDATDALRDPTEGDDAGIRLVLPSSLGRNAT